MTEQNQRYRIALIAKEDAFYESRKELIGKEGTIRQVIPKPGNWAYCVFTLEQDTLHSFRTITFLKVLLKKLPPKEPPHATT